MRAAELCDERGAIMVIAVFMATFMAAMLMYVLGIGEAVLYRERMQDAADAAALSAAVTHARGMNLIVLINLVMAAMLSVLVALRLVQMLAMLAIAIAFAASFLAPAAAAAIPPLKVVHKGAGVAYTKMKEPIMTLLKMLNVTARSVKSSIPVAAQAGVINSVVGYYSPPATIGFALPSRLTLPVENDKFSVLCDKAGDFVGQVVMYPLDPLVPDIASDAVSEALGSLTGSATAWFCGKPGGPSGPPTLTRKVKHIYPRLSARQACDRVAEDMSRAGQNDHAVCQEAERDDTRSEPDRRGRCRQDCGSGGAYVDRAKAAREQCDPASGRPLTEYHWVEQTVEISFEHTEAGWKEVDRRPSDSQRLVEKGEKNSTPPCGTDDAVYDREWNKKTYDSPDADAHDRPIPVCVEPYDLPEGGEVGDTESVEAIEVLHILRCSEKKEHKIGNSEGFSDNQRAQGGRQHSPQKVEDDVALGSEAFQLRAIVIGGSESPSGEAIDMALWGHEADSALSGLGDWVDWLSVAQAEYYYDHDGSEDRAEWMWSQKWRARLVRFRLPEVKSGGRSSGGRRAAGRSGGSRAPNPGPSSASPACAASAGKTKEKCQQATGALSKLSELVIH